MTRVLLGRQNVQVRVTTLTVGGLQAQAAAEAALVSIANNRAAAELAETNAEAAADSAAIDAQSADADAAAAALAKGAAESARDIAVLAQNNAENAADEAASQLALVEAAATGGIADVQAAVNAEFYADTTAGIAGTVDGEFFTVIESGRIVTYENESEVAVEKAVAPKYDDLDVVWGGQLGGVFVKASDALADSEYVGREALGDQPTADIDVSSDSIRQILIDNALSNPTARATASVVGGKQRITLAITANIAVTLATAERPIKGRLYRAGLTVITSLNAAQDGQFALGFNFRGDAPTPGATVANDTAGNPCVVMRYSGDVQALTFSGGGGGTTASGVTVSNEAIYQTPDPMKKVEILWTVTNATGTAGHGEWYQEGRLLASCDVTGLPANSYIGPVARFASTTGNVVEYEPLTLYAPSLALPRDIYADANASAGGSGTATDPFGTVAEILDAINVDTNRKTFRLHLLNGGVWDDFSLGVPAGVDLELYGEAGTRPEIHASTAIASGAGAFTLVSGEVWKVENVGDILDLGGIVQTDRPSTFGLNDETTLDWSLYARRSPNYEATSLLRGEMTAHTGGTHEGAILIRCWDGSDPNDHTWRVASQSATLYGTGGSRIKVRNVIVGGGYTYGGHFDGCELDIDGAAFRMTSVGYGMDHKDCWGRVTNSDFEGTYADNCHANDSTLPAGARPTLTFEKCRFRGGFLYNDGAGFEVAADNYSPHKYNKSSFIECEFASCGKDCVSSSGGTMLLRCTLRDAVDSGVKLYMENGETDERRLTISDSNVIGCGTGLKLDGGPLEDVVGFMEANNIAFRGNVTRNVDIFSTATAKTLEIELNDCGASGPAPASPDRTSDGCTRTVNAVTKFTA